MDPADGLLRAGEPGTQLTWMDAKHGEVQMRAVVDCCGRELLTSHGLRSLSPKDPGYIGRYMNLPRAQDLTS